MEKIGKELQSHGLEFSISQIDIQRSSGKDIVDHRI